MAQGSNQMPMSLLKGRLGIYDKYPFDPGDICLKGVEH
jgi:hypothetical protein